MTAVAAGAPAKIGLGAGVVGLLALAVFINYVDRGNLATAAPLIKDTLGLSTVQIGLLLSAFFWTYTPAQILVGWLAEKINAYRTLAFGLAIWSLATALTGLASGFVALFALRLALGIGESAAFPCSSKLLAQHLPEHRLGWANGLIGVGLALGPAFGTYFGGMMMAQVGWRPVFLVFGGMSLLWLVPWLLATRHQSAHADRPSETTRAPSFAALLRRRETWGASLGHFCGNYAFYFVISWLPLYLVKARGFSVAEMAQIGGLIYVVYAASTMATGWLSDRCMAAGASANFVRKTIAVIGPVGVAGAMLGCALGDRETAVFGLFAAGLFFGFGTPNVFAIAQIVAGPRAAGKFVGVQNFWGSVAGISAPIVTALVVDTTGQFTLAFVVAAAISLIGILGWVVMIRRIAPIAWECTA
jgi:MFS family permease